MEVLLDFKISCKSPDVQDHLPLVSVQHSEGVIQKLTVYDEKQQGVPLLETYRSKWGQPGEHYNWLHSPAFMDGWVCHYIAADLAELVTVGMSVTRHPPYRSVRALQTHTAPTSSIWRENELLDIHEPLLA